MRLIILLALLFFPAFAQAAETGEKIYMQKCAACHALDKNKVGPYMRGVYGRQAGAVDGFHYSKALKSSGIIWDDVTLDAWLKRPSALVKGAQMALKMEDAKERAAVISYLKTLVPDK